ncbi:MAG: flagellar export chaperone FliS [Planctomycetota bacterium]
MAHDTAQSYLRTRVMSASPEELRLMLLDGAIRFATQAREGLAAKDYEKSYEGITQARAICAELATAVDRNADPELCDRTTGVFLFLFQELTEASLNKEPARVGRVIELLEYERETWALAMEQIRSDRQKASSAAPAAVEAGQADGSLSVRA